ncbi:MAG: class I SAM-dependent methyltransferase, partial [Candidatus Sumerlaeaceae bacterium]
MRNLESFGAYAEWIYGKLEPFLGQCVVEIGAGIGNNIEFLCRNSNRAVLVTDVRSDYVEYLNEKFRGRTNLQVMHYDATQPPPADLIAFGADTMVCTNVLEHIEEDRAALRHMFEILQAG